MSRLKYCYLLYLAIGVVLLMMGLPESQVKAQGNITITAPEGITELWLTQEDNQSLISTSGSVTSDIPFNVYVSDIEIGKPEGTAGKLAEYSGSSYVTDGRYLTDNVTVWSTHTNKVPSEVILSGTEQLVLSNVEGLGIGNPIDLLLSVTQDIEIGDEALPADHWYRIVITFTASAVS